MAVMLFLFVLVILYHRTPKQSACPAPAIDKDSVLEPLVTRGHDQRVVFARCVRIRFTPVEHERLGLEFYQLRSNVLGPVPTPAALSQADIVQENRKLRIESDTIFFFESARGRMCSVRHCLGFGWIDVGRKSRESFGQVFD